MKKLASIFAFAAISLCSYFPLKAQGQNNKSSQKEDSHLVMGSGLYDVFRNDPNGHASSVYIEWRPAVKLGLKNLKPFFNTETTLDLASWFGAGLLYHIKLKNDRLVITPAAGLGYYLQGLNRRDLGFPLQFMERLEIDYKLKEKLTVGIYAYHKSNGEGIGLIEDIFKHENTTNRGVEVLGIRLTHVFD